MTIEVTADQVDNARLLLALAKARGLTSAEWVVRLANAKPSTPPPPSTPPSPAFRHRGKPPEPAPAD